MSVRLTCTERDAVLLDPATGRVWKSAQVVSSLTDMDGWLGEPRIETTWELENGDLYRDVRHPGRDGAPDVRPCEHWKEESNDPR